MRGVGSGLPAGDRLGIGVLAVPEDVLEQDPQGVGEALDPFQPEDLVAPVADGQGGCSHQHQSTERLAVPS